MLQALVDSGLPFCFKGGTSLLLLLEHPKRLSTDIDIVVPKKIDFDTYFHRIKDRYPFLQGEERGKRSNAFRHFYFHPKSSLTSKDCVVNLDVAFEDDPFLETIEKEIAAPFLLTGGEKSYVKIPTPACILGDKLAAFAPHTLGVYPFATSLGNSCDNRLQVMKQLFDVAQLFDLAPSFDMVRSSYGHSVDFENRFRGTSFTMKDVLLDSLDAALCVASQGRRDPNQEYRQVFAPALQPLNAHLFYGAYNQNAAAEDACKVVLLCAGLLKGVDIFHEHTILPNKSNLADFKYLHSEKAFQRIRQALGLLDSK
ncbi:MAG: nucleotidyl transferase AbiEii/AbiGii toxin family protein [Bacilli bacterium]|nr:nucleotidyl transferase AbiEii/AbiGii toxin family protein [Bacilli bacterium]